MPVDKYYKGSGDKVMSSMKEEYGDKTGESVFYATANKTGMKPGNPKNRKKLITKAPNKLGPRKMP